MVTVGMYYDVIPQQAELFRAKFRDVLAVLDATPGHTRSFLYQRVDDPDSYAILSEWEDREAFLAFIRSDVFRQVTNWGREQVLRGAPRHTIYPRSEELGREEGAAR
jgi:heme-degrading monooxygenase HmoA